MYIEYTSQRFSYSLTDDIYYRPTKLVVCGQRCSNLVRLSGHRLSLNLKLVNCPQGGARLRAIEKLPTRERNVSLVKLWMFSANNKLLKPADPPDTNCIAASTDALFWVSIVKGVCSVWSQAADRQQLLLWKGNPCFRNEAIGIFLLFVGWCCRQGCAWLMLLLSIGIV